LSFFCVPPTHLNTDQEQYNLICHPLPNALPYLFPKKLEKNSKKGRKKKHWIFVDFFKIVGWFCTLMLIAISDFKLQIYDFKFKVYDSMDLYKTESQCVIKASRIF